MRKYTDQELISELHRFYKENHRSPTGSEFNKNNNYPTSLTYKNHFGSWNNALEIAGLKVCKYTLPKNNKECYICGTVDSKYWRVKDNKIVCSKCIHPRNYIHGTLDPNSNCGIGVITEHIVYEVLEDCEKCNTPEIFVNKYDLISEKYGIINVKSAKLCKRSGIRSYKWMFRIHENSIIPDYYICLGFNENRSEILKVWIISGNSVLINTKGIYITNSKNGLKRAIKYEVDPTPYNNVYQNLDIYTLPEFRNLNNINITNKSINIYQFYT